MNLAPLPNRVFCNLAHRVLTNPAGLVDACCPFGCCDVDPAPPVDGAPPASAMRVL